MIRSTSLFFLLFASFLLLETTHAENNIWHQVVSFQSHIIKQDYTKKIQGQIIKQPFTLTIYRHHFTLSLPLESSDNVYTYKGTVTSKDAQSISGQSFTLNGTEVTGEISSQLNHGIKWTYKLKVPTRSFIIERSEIRYSYLIWVLLFTFMIAGFFLFPLVDKDRNKVLYNIKKRTHPLLEYTILIKIIWLWGCFLLNCYHTLTNVNWYWIVVVLTVELFTVTPSLIQAMYFCTTMQRHIKEMNCFKELSVTVKCLIMSFIFLSVPIIGLATLFVDKGIAVYFGLSISVLVQFIFSCKQKIYTFGRVLAYDFVLTALLTVQGAFLPSLHFIPLTFKDLTIFWNFYIGLFVFGILLSRKLIKLEIVEEHYVEEFSETLPEPPVTAPNEPTDSERRHQLPEIKTNQALK